MINVINQFQEDNLNIEFSGDSIETHNISVSVSNDVNFKPIIDYLIRLIPIRVKLESTFEDFNQEENFEKLSLIKDTVSAIYEKFNSSIKSDETFEVTEHVDERRDGNVSDEQPF